MSANIPARPPDIDKLDSVDRIQPQTSQMTPEEGKFSKMMEEPSSNPMRTTGQPSPMQINPTQAPGAPPTLASLQAQMHSVSGSLGDIKNQLHTKGLKLKQSEKYRLRNHLASANDNIRGAVQRVGVNPGAVPNLSGKHNPIAKFLELVTDGQNQMNSAAMQIQHLTDSGTNLNAGQLLLVQAKLQKASQELEYTSILLGKATDMIKTLFNVQI